MELEESLTLLCADLEAAEAELRAAQGRVTELSAARAGLEFTMRRYGKAPVGVRPTAATASPVNAGQPVTEPPSQADLCMEALRDFGRPASTQEIREKLDSAGHAYAYEQVRGALGYLHRRKKKIERVGSNLWKLPAAPAPVTDVAPAASTAGANEAGENRTSSQGGVLTGAGLNSHPARQASF